MAKSSPHVNKHLDLIVATDDKQWFSSTHPTDKRFPEHSEINIKNLQQLCERYGTRHTSNLGIPVSRKAKRER